MTAQRKFRLAVIALMMVFVVGTAGYRLIEEDVSIGQAAYMTIITLSTVGFGHVWELSDTGKAWTGAIIVFGILVVTIAFASLQAILVSGELRRVLGRRKLANKIGKMEGHFIVCGYGRMGKLISDYLRSHGKKVAVVETDDNRTMQAEEDGVPYVLGDATDEELLQDAGIHRAGGLITALAGDADNVFVTLTAATIRKDIPIIARAEFYESEPKLKRAGATHVVCPHAIGAIRMANLLARPAVAHLVDITTAGVEWEIEEAQIKPNSQLTGKTLKELHIRDKLNATVIAIRKPDGKTVANPGANAVIEEGDHLVVIGPVGIADTLRSFESEGILGK